jgi:hypothetical protein
MAIARPEALDAAPLGAGAFSGGWRRPAFLFRDAKPSGGGKKPAGAVAVQAIEAKPVSG